MQPHMNKREIYAPIRALDSSRTFPRPALHARPHPEQHRETRQLVEHGGGGSVHEQSSGMRRSIVNTAPAPVFHAHSATLAHAHPPLQLYSRHIRNCYRTFTAGTPLIHQLTTCKCYCTPLIWPFALCYVLATIVTFHCRPCTGRVNSPRSHLCGTQAN